MANDSTGVVDTIFVFRKLHSELIYAKMLSLKPNESEYMYKTSLGKRSELSNILVLSVYFRRE